MKTRIAGIALALFALLGCGAQAAPATLVSTDVPVALPSCPVPTGTLTNAKEIAYSKCRFDRLEAMLGSSTSATPSTSPTTATPSPTTVTPSATSSASPPPAVAYPGPANTGVPAGTTMKASGSVTVTTPGTVIDGLDITGTLVVKADNVTVKNTRVKSTDYWPVYIADSATGVVFTDSEVDGLGTKGAEGSSGVVGGKATLQRLNIHGVENGIVPGSGTTLRDSWIHDLAAAGSPHYDGVQIDGGQSDITLRHNTIDVSTQTQTSAVMIDNYDGPVDRITVEGNVLRGGGYTVYSDGQFAGGPITGVVFNDNRLGSGYYGYSLIRNNTVTWTRNVDYATGAAVNR